MHLFVFVYTDLLPGMGGPNISAVLHIGDDRWASLNGKSFWSRIPAIRSRLLEVGPEALEIEELNLPNVAPIVLDIFDRYYDLHWLQLYFLEHGNMIYYIYQEGYGKFLHDESGPIPDVRFTLMAQDGPVLTAIDWDNAGFLHEKVRASHLLFAMLSIAFI